MSTTDSDVREIERRLDETRQSMRHTLEALERKLSPEMLLHKTVDRVRENGGMLAGNLSHAVRDNPVPMLLTSIGLAWLMMGNRQDSHGHDGRDGHDGASRNEDREHAGRFADSARHMGESARHLGENARERAHRAADSARHVAASARDGYAHAYERVHRLMEGQPLVLGVVGLAAGALIGAMMPPAEAHGEGGDGTGSRDQDEGIRSAH